jgi:sugar (pentulose or hexulose) kinase
VWCQILADALARPIRCAAQPRAANVRGAALLAFLALGRIKLDDIASRVAITEEFQPNPANRECYDRLGRAFQQAFHRNRAIFRALNSRGPQQ